MKNTVDFKGIGSTGIDSVKNQRCGREGHKAFGEGAVFGLGPFWILHFFPIGSGE
jgi:hypothetical protein